MRHPASSKNDAHPVHRPPGLRSWSGNTMAWVSIGRYSFQVHKKVRLRCMLKPAGDQRQAKRQNNRSHANRWPSSQQSCRRSTPSLDWRPVGRCTGCASFFDEAGCLIEKSRPHSSRQFRIGLGMSSLVTFFAPKKVTRAPARKRCQALPVHHDPPTSAVPHIGGAALHPCKMKSHAITRPP
jgi:hypothetical protein